MEKEKKKKPSKVHHYVFQAYLKSWTNDGQLWCKRNGIKQFRTHPKSIAQDDYFYRINDLNDDEMEFFKGFISRLISFPKEENEILTSISITQLPKKLQTDLDNEITKAIQLYGEYENIPIESKTAFLHEKKLIETAKIELLEKTFSSLEGEGIKWINLLKSEDLNFYYRNMNGTTNYSEIDKCNFLRFIGLNNLRTKAVRDRLIKHFGMIFHLPGWGNYNFKPQNINLSNLVDPLCWASAYVFGNDLFVRDAHLTLLVNNTNIPFITSDQPIINLNYNYGIIWQEIPETFLYYYPISPRIAITINEKSNSDKMKIEINLEQVHKYNKAIVESSYQNIFANCENIFDMYI